MISLIDINEAIQNNNHFFPNELITTALRNTGKSEIASNSLYSILTKNGLDNVSQETMYNALEDAKIRTIRFTAKNGYVGKKYNKEAIINNMASFLYAIKKIHMRLGKSFPVLSYDKLPSVTDKNIPQDKSEMEKASNELLKNDDVWYEGKMRRNVIFAEGQLARLKENIDNEDFRYHGRQMNFEPNTASKNADTTIFKSTQQNGVRRSKNDLNVDVRILPKSGVKCYNLYKIKNMSVNKTLKHGTNKFGDKIAWNHEGDKGIDYTHSIDWFIQRSIVYMKYIIGNQPVDVITYPQSSSTFNDMIARKLHAMFPQSQGIKLQPKLLIKNVRGMKVNVPMAKSLGLTDEEIMHLQQRVEVTWKQQEDIRDARRQMEALKKELEALLISRAHQKGRKPEKQIAYINQEIDLYDQLVKAKRKHMRGPDPTIDQDGNVKDWQIKILDDKIRRAIDNIFTLNPEMKNMASKLQGKSVVLFDDNLSSGATMDELCIALKQLGVANIIPITLGTIDPTIYQRSERLNRNNGKD